MPAQWLSKVVFTSPVTTVNPQNPRDIQALTDELFSQIREMYLPFLGKSGAPKEDPQDKIAYTFCSQLVCKTEDSI